MLIVVPPEAAEERLDLFLRARCPDLSRSRIQALVKMGDVLVNGGETRQAYPVQPGDEKAAKKFALVAEAHDVLSDPTKRRQYDQTFGKPQRRPQPHPPRRCAAGRSRCPQPGPRTYP